MSADVTFRDSRQRTARLQPAHTTTFARHRFLPIRLVGAEDAEALSCSRVGIQHESGECYHSGFFYKRPAPWSFIPSFHLPLLLTSKMLIRSVQDNRCCPK